MWVNQFSKPDIVTWTVIFVISRIIKEYSSDTHYKFSARSIFLCQL
jgi:hypothetical protein